MLATSMVLGDDKGNSVVLETIRHLAKLPRHASDRISVCFGARSRGLFDQRSDERGAWRSRGGCPVETCGVGWKWLLTMLIACSPMTMPSRPTSAISGGAGERT